MRTGACTVQEALTVEAASVLKHSLNLGRRRGHAQVTPLHVAATLLSSSSHSSNLLRRACHKSQPHNPASHPFQCRALELCFNVALNRLPTIPPSSGSLLHPPPSFSNALVAALKRAQAHQRKGCIELQQQQPPQEHQHHHHQQPLLAIKVELEQLILSILDDPSVSRVMKEAGFSSTCVKSNLEEETSVLCHSSPLLLETHKDFTIHGGSFQQNHFFKLPSEQSRSPAARSSVEEAVNVVLELMLRKQGRRANAVVVGDAVSMTEGIVTELIGRVERGNVPDELKSSQFINLRLSYVQLRLMNRSDVDMKVSALRRKIGSLASHRAGGGVIIYTGDMRWAVDEEARDGAGFKPVEHMIAEMGRWLSEFRGSASNGGGTASSTKVWLLAIASFQTYMRCQMMQPSLESLWALQAVVVPSGDLALSLQPSSGLDSLVTKKCHYPDESFEPLKLFSMKGDEKFNYCTICASNFDREASSLNPETTEKSSSSVTLPDWMQPNRPMNQQKEDAVEELRRKWSRLCRSLHQDRQSLNSLCTSMFNQNLMLSDWSTPSQTWRSGSLQSDQSKCVTEANSISFSRIKSELASRFAGTIFYSKSSMASWPEKAELSLRSLKFPAREQVGTSLSLGSSLCSDSATSKDRTKHVAPDLQDVRKRLQENIPWQSEVIPSILEALQDFRSREKKGTWILIQGSDHVAKRRIALVMVESFCGLTDKLIRTNLKSCVETIKEALAEGAKYFLIEGISQPQTNSIKSLMNDLKDANLAGAIFIFDVSKSSKSEEANENSSNRVLKIRLHVEDSSSSSDFKRKREEESQSKQKRLRRTGDDVLDLNLMAEVDKEDAPVASDPTHETDSGHLLLPQELLESTVHFTLEAGEERSRQISENVVSKLRRSFGEASRSAGADEEPSFFVDQAAAEELTEASGFFLESLLETWTREVVLRQGFSLTVKKGGSVTLVVEGKEGNVGEFGFMGSVLPKSINF